MKAIILTLLLSISAFGQTVELPQKFVDRANQAFVEVKALRELDEARKSEISAKNDLITTQKALIDSLKASIESRDAQILALSKIKCDKTKFFWGIISKTTCR